MLFVDRVVKNVLWVCALIMFILIMRADAQTHIGADSVEALSSATVQRHFYGDGERDRAFIDIGKRHCELKDVNEGSIDALVLELQLQAASKDAELETAREENEELQSEILRLRSTIADMKRSDLEFLESVGNGPRSNPVAVVKVQSITWLDSDGAVMEKAEFVGEENRGANNWASWGHRARNVGRRFVLEEDIERRTIAVKAFLGSDVEEIIAAVAKKQLGDAVKDADIIFLVPETDMMIRSYREIDDRRFAFTDVMGGIDDAYDYVGITVITPMTNEAMGLDD